jgi:predicted ArsR family transcriptional regulator
VSVDKVKACVPSGPFTAKALEEASGATGATARKAIAELVAAGSVESLGPDPEYSGRGRAPTLYKSA